MSGGKVAFVTGASRGIGRGIAEALLAAGYQVAIGYNTGKNLAVSTADSSKTALAVHVDVSNALSIEKAVSQTEKQFGPIDILVNNAGIAQQKPFLELEDTDWERMISVNLLGAVRCSRCILPSMIERKRGRIINISSIGGQWGGMFQVHYAAAKAGLINFTMSLAKLYSRQGVTCNAIAPGLIETDMIAQEMQDPAAEARIEGIPMGRLGSVQEVAATVVFLASDAASYVTGQTINVNGGLYFG